MAPTEEEEESGRARTILRRLQQAVESTTVGGGSAKQREEDFREAMAYLLALGPHDPSVRRWLVAERNPTQIVLARTCCEIEGELRGHLQGLLKRHKISPAVVMMLFSQILKQMVIEAGEEPIGAWRRYLVAVLRPRKTINRRLVRQLGYGILAHEQAVHSGQPTGDIGPPVSAQERGSL